MNPLRTFIIMACLLTVAYAKKENSSGQRLKPSEWLSKSDLESIPSVDEVTLERLESLSPQEGARLVNRIYHLSQINFDLKPSYVPSQSNVPAYIFKPNGQKQAANLNTLAETVNQEPNFGAHDVTVYITGLPEKTQSVAKANKKLIEAYLQRNNRQQQQQQQKSQEQDKTSSEEDNSTWNTSRPASGNLIVIDLGSQLTTFKRYAMLDIERTGAMIGKALVQMTASEKNGVRNDNVHIVAQGIAAHVAGAAGREYKRETGLQVRRITALDPSKIFAKDANTLTGLARGDADFVDAIHTSANAMGSRARVGNADFYPNGPSASVPGADSVVEASMRATRYYAESVRPGNERNFPAAVGNSLQQYKDNNGYGKLAYMGIDADYDLEGDFVLQVNPQSPFGKMAPAHKPNAYHSSWKNSQDNE